MAKRIFNVPPDLCDDSTNDVPSFFQPGNIIKNLDADNLESEETILPSTCPPEKKAIKSEAKILPKCENTGISNLPSMSDKKPLTSFEGAFSGLKSSKFYEEQKAAVLPERGPKVSGVLLVNPRQRGNPLLKCIRSVPWEFAEMEPDYVMGKTTCALFLSMRYHNLFPNYIHERLKALGKSYQLQILLVQVDIVEPSEALKDLSVIAILADCTLMVSWSPEEAGNYLETYKMFENKSADLIKEKQFDDSFSQLIDCLTTVRSINKTDAMILLASFGTLSRIFEASVADLAVCPGIGPLKAKRLFDAFRKPAAITKK